ncbi:MAG: hypothetical protein HRU15_09180 [Planctomycetes bacterium]|nr:hypothetical protein [Planctomycetota bacterium]
MRILYLFTLSFFISTALFTAETVDIATNSTPSTEINNTELVSVNMYVDQAQASIGDEITVHIDYQWPKGWIINKNTNPAIYFTNAGAFLLEAPPVEDLTIGSRQQQKWQLTILTQSSGAWSLPQPGFQVTDPQGMAHVASAPEVIIQVGIEKNPPQLSAQSELWSSADSDNSGVHSQFWIWIIAALLICAILVVVFRPKKEPILQLSPLELFQQSFIRAQSAADGKDAAAELSQGLRRFCGMIWKFDGIAATNREMRSLLQDHIASDELRHICSMLDNIESVRWTAAEAQLMQMHSLASDAQTWCQQQQNIINAQEETLADSGAAA